eukprot:scaffold102875_cov20-Tisochrysis_lutea.AAC.2
MHNALHTLPSPAHIGVQHVGEEAVDCLKPASKGVRGRALGDGSHKQANEPGQAAGGAAAERTTNQDVHRKTHTWHRGKLFNAEDQSGV